MRKKKPLVGVVMGSASDWSEMQEAVLALQQLGIRVEYRVVSAHRTPELLYEYGKGADGRLSFIIAGAGGSAHLPGMLASLSMVPVLGVPLGELDSVYSMANMPRGIPLGVVGVGGTGAFNAALFVARMLALNDPTLENMIRRLRESARDDVLAAKLDPPQ